MLTTDALWHAVGAVVSQVFVDGEHPVVFTSKKLNDVERNYGPYDLELTAIHHVLHQWRHHLLGVEVMVCMDYQVLHSLLSQKDLSPKQAHWVEELADYHLTIVYKPGQENVVMDALS